MRSTLCGIPDCTREACQIQEGFHEPVPSYTEMHEALEKRPVGKAPELGMGYGAAQSESARRKRQPLARGCMRYFPDALLAVAELSLYGNEKHNPGEDLHWSRDKSTDHADCAARHLLEPFGIDTSYGPGKHVLHSVAAAWRALANAQVEIEELRKQGKWPL